MGRIRVQTFSNLLGKSLILSMGMLLLGCPGYNYSRPVGQPGTEKADSSYPMFRFTSATKVDLGKTITLSAETNLGSVTYEIHPQDAHRASIQGAELKALSPGPVRALAHVDGRVFQALMAVVDDQQDFIQLAPVGNRISIQALHFSSQYELDEFPLDVQIQEQDFQKQSVLLLGREAIGTDLDLSGSPATLSVVATAQGSAGYLSARGGQTQIQRFLLPPGLEEVNVQYYWQGPIHSELQTQIIPAARPPFTGPELSNIAISAEVSPSPMAFGRPFTLSGRILGPMAKVPSELYLSLYGGVWGWDVGPTEVRNVPIATVSIQGRNFSYTGTLPATVSDGKHSLDVVPEVNDGPGKHGYTLFLGPAPKSGQWQHYIKWE